jgi:hypothetical protein
MSESKLRAIISQESDYREQNVSISGVNIGRPDFMDDTYVYENKKISEWKHALGQVLVYAYATKKKPALGLIASSIDDSLISVIKAVCSRYDVKVEIIPEDMINNTCKHLGIDKDTNWRYHLTKDALLKCIPKELQKEAKECNKEPMILRYQQYLTLDKLLVDDLKTLVKKKGGKTSDKKKADLLTEVKQLWGYLQA